MPTRIRYTYEPPKSRIAARAEIKELQELNDSIARSLAHPPSHLVKEEVFAGWSQCARPVQGALTARITYLKEWLKQDGALDECSPHAASA